MVTLLAVPAVGWIVLVASPHPASAVPASSAAAAARQQRRAGEVRPARECVLEAGTLSGEVSSKLYVSLSVYPRQRSPLGERQQRKQQDGESREYEHGGKRLGCLKVANGHKQEVAEPGV